MGFSQQQIFLKPFFEKSGLFFLILYKFQSIRFLGQCFFYEHSQDFHLDSCTGFPIAYSFFLFILFDTAEKLYGEI